MISWTNWTEANNFSKSNHCNPKLCMSEILKYTAKEKLYDQETAAD